MSWRGRHYVGGWAVVCLLCFCSAYAQTPGPGIGNLSYNSNQLFTIISRLNSTTGTPRGHGFVSMVNGYLFVIYANDGGGGNGSGGFAFLNLSNPYQPSYVFTTQGTPGYTSGQNYPGDIRVSIRR